MAKSPQDCVIGVFPSRETAGDALRRLQAEGLDEGNVSLITRGRDDEVGAAGPLDQGDRMEKGAAMGAATGATLGLLASSALLVIPGIGPVAFAGAMASGITGGLVGGLVGAMTNWGVKEDHAAEYERELQAGKTLVVASGDPLQLAEVQSVLESSDAEHVALHAESADSTVDR